MDSLGLRYLKSLVRPGDILLYDNPGLFGWIIKIKRGEKYTHVEIAISPTQAVSSRNGIGVAKYDIDWNIAAIYRPIYKPDIEKGMKWFETVNGQKYDFFGLLAFTWAEFRGRDNNKMFCSEFSTRFLRECGIHPFSNETDADAISPEMLSYSDEVVVVWLRKDKRKKG